MRCFHLLKTGREDDNEDLIYIDENFLAIFDGAISKSKGLWEGKTSGRLTVEIIKETVKSRFYEDIDCETAISMIQSSLRSFSEENSLEEKEIFLCASGVIYSVKKHQIWLVGDCQFSINGKVTSPVKKIDRLLSEVRSLAIRCLLLEGKTEEELLENDEARNWIMNILKRQHYLENEDGLYGFSVFSGKGIIKEFSVVDVPNDAEVIIASDGYPVLLPILKESEEKLKEIIENDPLCWKQYLSTKGLIKGNQSFDDRSYLRFVVE